MRRYFVLILLGITACGGVTIRNAGLYGQAMTDIVVQVRIGDRKWATKGCAVLAIGDRELNRLRLPPEVKWCARLDDGVAIPVVMGDESLCEICLPPPRATPIRLEALTDAEVEEILMPPAGGD